MALAVEVCKYMGIDEEKALKGMRDYHKDPGCLKTLAYKNEKGHEVFL